MSNFRNKMTQIAAVLLFLLMVLAPSTGDALDGQEKKINNPEESQKVIRSDNKKSTPEEERRQDRTFIPREKISAGKPVSFPTDI